MEPKDLKLMNFQGQRQSAEGDTDLLSDCHCDYSLEYMSAIQYIHDIHRRHWVQLYISSEKEVVMEVEKEIGRFQLVVEWGYVGA